MNDTISFVYISKIFAQTNQEVIFMLKKLKNNTNDKLQVGPWTTGSFGSSTDANLTTDTSGASGDDSHDLFIHLKNDKKHI